MKEEDSQVADEQAEQDTPAADAETPAGDAAAETAPEDAGGEAGAEDAGTDLAVVEPRSVNVEVPADALEKAVAQLQQLTALRRQEAERQERMLMDMRETVRRHTWLHRVVLVAALVVLASIIGLAMVVRGMRRDSSDLKADVRTMDRSLLSATRVIRDSSASQTRELGAVKQEVAAARKQQDAMRQSVVSELGAAREVIDQGTRKQAEGLENVKTEVTATRANQASLSKLVEGKLGETVKQQAEVSRTVTASLKAVREERDAVREVVERMLAEQTRELTARELVLEEETRRVAAQAEEAREEKNRIISEAIERLAAMAELSGEDEPDAAQDTDEVGTGSEPSEAGAREGEAPADEAAQDTPSPVEGIL